MIVNQIYELINSVSRQAWGAEAASVQDMSGLIALGRSIGVDSNFTAGADKFLNALVDRIGKTVIRTVDTRLDFPNLMVDGFEFGAILSKIDIQPIAAQQDNSWNIGENDFSSDYLAVYKPSVSQYLFDTVDTWTCKVTIPDVAFRSAFTSESAMASFINGIMDALTKSIESQLNKMSHMAVCNLIAEKKKASSNYINLVSMYNTSYSAELTAEEALINPQFLKFAGFIIRNYIKYMRDESVKFNTANKVRATSRDNMHVMMLSVFADATDTFLSADTYHDEMVKLPLYTEVNYWQNAGTTATPTLDELAKVNIIPSSEKDQTEPTAEEVENVICVLADRQTIGTTIKDRWSAADRFNSERRTNYTQGATIGYYNDLSENCVIFTLN